MLYGLLGIAVVVCRMSVTDLLWLNGARGDRIRPFRWDEDHQAWMTL